MGNVDRQMAPEERTHPTAKASVHVACIMDGNGRWARRRGLPRTAGHTAGEETLAEVVRLAAKRDVGYLTVFGFSTENWVRPQAEVRHILKPGSYDQTFALQRDGVYPILPTVVPEVSPP